jgi:hypothetical protein
MLRSVKDLSQALEGVLSNTPAVLFGDGPHKIPISGENWQIFTLDRNYTIQNLIPEIRKWILGDGDSDASIIQVVGDSATPFSKKGTLHAEAKLFEFFQNLEGGFRLLWGLTGQRGPDGEKDANQIVNDWIDAEAESRSRIAFANIVDVDTIRVLKNGSCMCPIKSTSQRNFIALCGGATFGDDIKVSDSLTYHLLVLEGGSQSFAQAINVLERGGKVYVIDGLRKGGGFSAASTLRKVKDCEEGHHMVGEKCRSNIFVL